MGLVEKDRLRAKLKGGDTTVRVLLAHPMHTGRGKDESGNLIPAQFIQDIRCWRNKEEVLTIKCGTATSRNPYFSFLLAGGAVDDTITIRWVDNVGEKGIVETKVQ
jgi:thiosulfate oxidation carrier complex protein SoxZ